MSVTAGLDVDQAFVPVTGAIYRGTAAATLPTDASTALGAGWTGTGYAFKDDGVEVNPEDGVSVKEVRGFQNDALLAEIRTGGKVTIKFSWAQVNADTVAAFYNDTPSASGGVRMRPNAVRPKDKWVVDIVSGTRVIRHTLGEATVAPTGPVKYVNDNIPVFPVILTGYADADGVSGNTYYSDLVSAVPTIASVLPSGEGAGEIVTITGTGFLGATAVDFGASAATDFLVIDSTTIVATLPTGSAGSVNVVVTNAVGASDPYAYTRA